MTINCGTAPEESMYSTSKLLYDIPIPLGSTSATTQTYNYDQNCFYIYDEKSTVIVDRDVQIENINLLYDHIKNHLFIGNIENTFCWYSSNVINDGYLDVFTRWAMWFVEKKESSCETQLKSSYDYVTPEILQICEEWKITEYLFNTIKIVEKYFPLLHNINVTLEKDYEIDEDWIALEITIEGDIDEILDKYDKYSENFVYSIPWPERDKIRLTYNII